MTGDAGPDVLTLRSESLPPEPASDDAVGLAVAVAPPPVRFTAALEMDVYTARRRTLVIRHSSNDRIIALLEILSPGNKASQYALDRFVNKAVAALSQGYHLLLVDLFPPGPRDPQGIHGILWAALGDGSYTAPADKPLTLAAYSAGLTKVAYVEPFAVGDALKGMPLFLSASRYVTVPLEESYQAAYRGVPRRWQRVAGGRGSLRAERARGGHGGQELAYLWVSAQYLLRAGSVSAGNAPRTTVAYASGS